MVRLLPFAQRDMTFSRRKFDYRLICPCQMHARRSRIRRFAEAAGARLRRRGIALAVGIPLTVCALGFPTEAMNITLPALSDALKADPANTFHIFTTRKVRESFLGPQKAPHEF